MLLGTAGGLLALWALWGQRPTTPARLRLAMVLGSFYWLTQAGSLLFPGTALVDPEFAQPGQRPAQLIVAVVMLSLLAIGYWLELGQLKRAG